MRPTSHAPQLSPPQVAVSALANNCHPTPSWPARHWIPLCHPIAILALPLILAGCAAVEVATLPIKATSKAIGLATTSQNEADRKAGRRARKAAEREQRATDVCGHRSGDCRGADGVPIYFEPVGDRQADPRRP